MKGLVVLIRSLSLWDNLKHPTCYVAVYGNA
jgi:hypothetical protein